MHSKNALTPKNLPEGSWKILLQEAFKIIDDLEARGGIAKPFWTFGGGTVLMLRYGHRLSKDIDIFVPDPQYLGYVSPRLSDVAAEVSEDYVEAAGYVKLIRPEGEIDFVAASNLTNVPFEIWHLLGREIKVETSAEIVAKKLWHRGHTATARDLFDLALVIEKDSDNLKTASEFLKKHREIFLGQLKSRQKILESQFNAINVLNFRPTFTESFVSAQAFINAL
jgi:predicted nucleotidyltransferase component of viral defense system